MASSRPVSSPNRYRSEPATMSMGMPWVHPAAVSSATASVIRCRSRGGVLLQPDDDAVSAHGVGRDQRAPSRIRNGLVRIKVRSLNVPGSPSARVHDHRGRLVASHARHGSPLRAGREPGPAATPEPGGLDRLQHRDGPRRPRWPGAPGRLPARCGPPTSRRSWDRGRGTSGARCAAWSPPPWPPPCPTQRPADATPRSMGVCRPRPVGSQGACGTSPFGRASRSRAERSRACGDGPASRCTRRSPTSPSARTCWRRRSTSSPPSATESRGPVTSTEPRRSP